MRSTEHAALSTIAIRYSDIPPPHPRCAFPERDNANRLGNRYTYIYYIRIFMCARVCIQYSVIHKTALAAVHMLTPIFSFNILIMIF